VLVATADGLSHRAPVGDIQRQGEQAVVVPVAERGERGRVTGRRDDGVTGVEGGLGEGTAKPS
jgi:hypothetical protein